MAVESLNRYIKKDKLMDRCHIRLEKLLNVLEEVVDDKMWKRILSIKRPNRNTYQGRVVIKAHRKATSILNKIKQNEQSERWFTVESASGHYNVIYQKTCNSDCREMYCQACHVCMHKYKCECVEYTVKNTTCKHVHAVAIYENKVEALNQTSDLPPSENDHEITNFLMERNTGPPIIISEEQKRNLVLQNAFNYMNQMSNLDEDSFKGKHKYLIFILSSTYFT